MARKSNQKGSKLEREVAVQLSLWWTDGKSDAVFWRTSGSGARATNRGKAGKSTANSAGDLCFIDDVGKDLLRVFTFELKRGYNKADLQRFIDYKGQADNIIRNWVAQAQQSASTAGTPYWAIISKADRKETLIHLPSCFYSSELSTAHIKTCYQNGDVYNVIVSLPFNEWLNDKHVKTRINQILQNGK